MQQQWVIPNKQQSLRLTKRLPPITINGIIHVLHSSRKKHKITQSVQATRIFTTKISFQSFDQLVITQEDNIFFKCQTKRIRKQDTFDSRMQ
jgi:hypothetical protein